MQPRNKAKAKKPFNTGHDQNVFAILYWQKYHRIKKRTGKTKKQDAKLHVTKAEEKSKSFCLLTIESLFRHLKKKKVRDPLKENHRTNVFLFRECPHAWHCCKKCEAGVGTDDKKEGVLCRMPQRGLEHKTGWGDKQAVAFPLACAHWIPLSLCLLMGLTLASV